MSCTLYRIVHVATGREYIGITSRKASERWTQHKTEARRGKSTSYIHRALRKYGIEAFSFEPLRKLPDWDAALAAECAEIAARKPAFNMSKGGEGTKGCKQSEETKAKRAAKLRGKTMSPEARELIRLSALGNQRGLGTKRTPETRAKMRLTWLGRKHSPETIAKLKAARAHISAETRAKMSAAAKARCARRRAEAESL